jgi:hypothetical protein
MARPPDGALNERRAVAEGTALAIHPATHPDLEAEQAYVDHAY